MIHWDERGQPVGIVRFGLSLLVGAFLIFIVSRVTSPLFNRARAVGAGTAGSKGTMWLSTAVEYLPLVFLMIAFFGLIALAIFQREAAS